MTHLTDDQLLLHAYGEVPEPDLDTHLAACAECRSRFTTLEESRVALEWGQEQRPARSGRRLAWLALPLAAGLGALLLLRQPQTPASEREVWRTHLVGSPTAGYVAGGAAFMSIDSQLTQLEQRSIHEPLRN